MLVDWKPDKLSGFCIVVCVLSHGRLFGTPQTVDAMECSLPDSSVRGIFQARIQEWIISSSRGSPQPRDRTLVSCISCVGRWLLYHWAPREAPHEDQMSSVSVQYKKRKRLHSRKLNAFRRPILNGIGAVLRSWRIQNADTITIKVKISQNLFAFFNGHADGGRWY